jgi:hypothetical protein
VTAPAETDRRRVHVPPLSRCGNKAIVSIRSAPVIVDPLPAITSNKIPVGGGTIRSDPFDCYR